MGGDAAGMRSARSLTDDGQTGGVAVPTRDKKKPVRVGAAVNRMMFIVALLSASPHSMQVVPPSEAAASDQSLAGGTTPRILTGKDPHALLSHAPAERHAQATTDFSCRHAHDMPGRCHGAGPSSVQMLSSEYRVGLS